jgi:hypothetical protein
VGSLSSKTSSVKKILGIIKGEYYPYSPYSSSFSGFKPYHIDTNVSGYLSQYLTLQHPGFIRVPYLPRPMDGAL